MQICHYVLWNFLSVNSVLVNIYCDWKNTDIHVCLPLFSCSKVQELLTNIICDKQLPRRNLTLNILMYEWGISVQLNVLIKAEH